VYLIAIRWIKTELNPAKVDAVLSPNGDWYRFNGYTWFFWTRLDQEQIYKVLSPHFHPDDSIVVMKADPSAYQGWAPKQFWDWLAAKKAAIRGGG